MRSYKFSDPENKVDLILSRADIFETPKDIDDFTNCPTHRSNLGVGWSRGSSSRCRVPKEVSGHGKGRVKSIPKADRGIGKLVSQTELMRFFYGQNIEHGYVNVLFNYVIVMRYNTSLKIK